MIEGPNQRCEKVDSIVNIAGSSVTKNGDVIITDAIKALHATGALRKLNVTVVMKREEAYPGDPLVEARAALIDAAKLSDLPVAFKGA